MANAKISEWSQTAGSNTEIDGVALGEGVMTPSQVNNAIRELMSQVAELYAGASGDRLPVTAGGTGSTSAAGARTSLGLGALAVKNTIDAADITAGAVGSVALATAAVSPAKLAGGTIPAATGYSATDYNAGTKSSGTYTPDPANGNFQYAVNGGAHTLAPPAASGSLIVQYTNNGSAGTITTSGFTKVSGSFTTTNGDDFLCYITRLNSFTHLNIVALQ